MYDLRDVITKKEDGGNQHVWLGKKVKEQV
jgi:hypothetical protein